MKLPPVGAQLFHADSRTNMTKLAVAFRNLANALKKEHLMCRPGLSVAPSVFLLPNIREQTVLSDFQEICYFSSLHTVLKRFVKNGSVAGILYSDTDTNLRL